MRDLGWHCKPMSIARQCTGLRRASTSRLFPVRRRRHVTDGSRKECAVVAGLLGIVLLLFELVLIARMVVDWIGVLSPDGGRPRPYQAHPVHPPRTGLSQARRITHGITEPVIGPVRRVLKPAQFGPVSIDLAFTAVFLAVIVL